MQADVSLLLGVHGTAGSGRLSGNVFPHQPALCHDRDRRADGAGGGATCEVTGDVVGLHQSGPDLSPGPQVPAAARQPQESHQVLATAG